MYKCRSLLLTLYLGDAAFVVMAPIEYDCHTNGV